MSGYVSVRTHGGVHIHDDKLTVTSPALMWVKVKLLHLISSLIILNMNMNISAVQRLITSKIKVCLHNICVFIMCI